MLPGKKSFDKYVADLQLRMKNNKKNLDANTLYRRTGQVAQMLDARTVEEKLADVQALRADLTRSLLAITDGKEASSAVDKLTPDELVFAAQNVDDIVKEMKPRFKYGVPSLALLEYIKALKRRFDTTKGVFPSGASFGNQIQISDVGRSPGSSQPSTSNSSPLVTPKRTPVSRPGGIDLNEMLRRSAEIRKAREGADIEGELRSSKSTPPNESAFLDLINRRRGGLRPTPSNAENIPQKYTSRSFETMPMEDFIELFDYYIGPDGDPTVFEYIPSNWMSSKSPHFMKKKPPPGGLAANREELRPAFDAYRRLMGLPPSAEASGDQLPFSSAIVGFDDTLDVPPGDEAPSSSSGSGFPVKPGFRRGMVYYKGPSRVIRGRGLKTVRIDESRGVTSVPTYVPFGKYIIHPSKLLHGELELRTMRGGAVVKFPSQKLSANLTSILTRVLDERLPDEHDLRTLSPEEHAFLFSLVKASKIDDRLHIPVPKLDKEEEEDRRFQLLKGQIIAGNDSKEVIKEFKGLLLKFADSGRLNKQSVREWLMTLTAAGF